MNQKLKIGLFGFGCVGQGLYDILCSASHFNSEIYRICVKDPNKPRKAPKEKFVYHRSEILDDPAVDLVVELISDAAEALVIAREALRKGRTVVSANKKMIAENFEELYNLQKQFGGTLLYEAACCGSIPIIRNLEEYFDNEPLRSVSGIFNGSTNYILTRIFEDGLSYERALKLAQENGFAEADPTLDVSGRDAANKLAIIISHAFGSIIHPDELPVSGIQNISAEDISFAKANGFKIKSVAHAQVLPDGRIDASVFPAFVDQSDELYHIDDELNAVLVNGRFSGMQRLVGKGAGGHPTGSAALSDISAALYRYKYGYKKIIQNDVACAEVRQDRPFYIRSKNREIFKSLSLETPPTSTREFFITTTEVDLQRLQDIMRENPDEMFVAALPPAFKTDTNVTRLSMAG